jgi:histidinol phosphatase-like PHP family hydrolase
METVIDKLGRLAAECDLEAASPDLLPWERESLAKQAQKYRDAQLAEMEREQPHDVAHLTARKIIAEMEEIGQERIEIPESERDNGIDFLVGLRNALLISIPIWALIIWGVWYLWRSL